MLNTFIKNSRHYVYITDWYNHGKASRAGMLTSVSAHSTKFAPKHLSDSCIAVVVRRSIIVIFTPIKKDYEKPRRAERLLTEPCTIIVAHVAEKQVLEGLL
jgi:hypothetical protein